MNEASGRALKVERGAQKGSSFLLPPGRPVVFGREKSCDFQIRDPMASRRHFEVRPTPGGRHVIRDLGSSNGTSVNGVRLGPQERRALELEDRIEVGTTQLSFVGAEADAKGQGELSGRTIGGYRIEGRIGRGAMGTVYRATQLSLDRVVALKILARELSADPRRLELFLAEARAAGRLNHPNIVQVYDVGEAEGLYYYSMEFMARGSVEDLASRCDPPGRLPLDCALRIAIDAARGLEYAERQGIVHRDIKPANLMVNAEGVTKLGDLGIALALRGGKREPRPADETRTRPDDERASPPEGPEEGICGSPLYMAPEQARGEKVDHRADLYSLGATLFHVLSGEPPFSGESLREVLSKHLKEPPRRLSDLNPVIPAEVSAIVEKLLSKEPADRPQSASVLLDSLLAIEARLFPGARVGSPSAAGKAGGAGDAGSQAKRWVRALRCGIAALAILALFFGALFASRAVSRARAERASREAFERAEHERRDGEERARSAEAERRGREEALAREREAVRALEKAESFLRDHADRLEEALRGYRDVLARYAGTSAEARARTQAEVIEGHLRALEQARAKKAERERHASSAFAELASEIEATPPERLSALVLRLERAAKEYEGTEAARGAPDVRRAILGKADRSLRPIQAQVERALEAGDIPSARAAVDRVAAWNLGEQAGWCEDWRKKIAAAESAILDAARAAEARARAQELAEIRAACDPAILSRLRFGEVRRALELLGPRIRLPEARAELEARLFAVRAEERLLTRLCEHIRSRSRPEIVTRIAGAIEGIAVLADEQGITFRARGNEKIELTRPFSSLRPEEVERFFLALELSPEERYALGAILRDLGDEERALRSFERALRDAEPALRARIERALGEATK